MDDTAPSGEVPDHPEPPADAPSIAAEALHRHIAAGEPVRLLDVRSSDEIEAWRIDGPSVTTTAIPLNKFLVAEAAEDVASLAEEVDGAGPITVVCAEGKASAYVAGLLEDRGVTARNLEGGMAGWARVYTATPIGTEPTLLQYHRPSSGCLSYMVLEGDAAAVVDPLRAFTDRYREHAAERDATIDAVVDTHVHADHVSGLRTLAAATGARRYLPAESVARGVTYAVEELEAGDAVAVGDATLETVALPGHTTGMTGIVVGDTLLSGDSLFLDGVARPDLQVAAADERETLARTLHETLTERLARFPDGTQIAPGHVAEGVEPAADGSFTATLGDLRETLAAFEADPATFADRVLADLPPPPANAERIVAINRGVESVDDAEAFELELGPNNCAAARW